MKTTNLLLAAFIMLGLMMLTTPATQAQTCDGTGKHFVDLNGDGFNDNAPDADGDGIPNGLDPDYVKYAQDGTGYKNGKVDIESAASLDQHQAMTKSQKFSRVQSMSGNAFQHRLGSLNGTVASGTGICNGASGASAGTGICDGTGPHGKQTKGGK